MGHVPPGSGAYWNADGREIFYRHGAGPYAVAVTPSPGDFQIGAPEKLFEGQYDIEYDARPDGCQFAMIQNRIRSARHPDTPRRQLGGRVEPLTRKIET